MSADDHDWALRLDPVDAAFKWALNGDSGELTVWEVGGPGDGFPSHRDALAAEWGREPDRRRGDVLGTAIANEETVAIVIYGISDGKGQTKAAPAPREWAKTRFPGHRVTVNGTPGEATTSDEPVADVPYRYELRQGEVVIATGHLTWQQPLAVGDQIRILGRRGIVRSIEPVIGELEQRVIVQLLPD